MILFAISISGLIISIIGIHIIEAIENSKISKKMIDFKKRIGSAQELLDKESKSLEQVGGNKSKRDWVARLENQIEKNREEIGKIENNIENSRFKSLLTGMSKKEVFIYISCLLLVFWQTYVLFFEGDIFLIYITIALFFCYSLFYAVVYITSPSIRATVLKIWILIIGSSILATSFGFGRIDGIAFKSEDIDMFEISVTYQDEKTACTSALLVTRGIICNSDSSVVFVERSMIRATRVL